MGSEMCIRDSSRTMTFAREFGEALSLADQVILLEIFGAREEPVEGVDSRIIGKHVSSQWSYQPVFNEVPESVAELAENGDMVLTIGAGTVTLLADEIMRALTERDSVSENPGNSSAGADTAGAR